MVKTKQVHNLNCQCHRCQWKCNSVGTVLLVLIENAYKCTSGYQRIFKPRGSARTFLHATSVSSRRRLLTQDNALCHRVRTTSQKHCSEFTVLQYLSVPFISIQLITFGTISSNTNSFIPCKLQDGILSMLCTNPQKHFNRRLFASLSGLIGAVVTTEGAQEGIR